MRKACQIADRVEVGGLQSVPPKDRVPPCSDSVQTPSRSGRGCASFEAQDFLRAADIFRGSARRAMDRPDGLGHGDSRAGGSTRRLMKEGYIRHLFVFILLPH